MHCVVWTYKTPPSLDKPAIEKLFDDVVDRYLGVPGLIRKHFGYSEDGAAVVGIYLWQSRAAADAFYTPQWLDGVTQRWGATPVRADWVIPVFAESREGRIVRA